MSKRARTYLALMSLAFAGAVQAADAPKTDPKAEERFGKGKVTIVNATARPVVAWFGKTELGPVPPNGRQLFEKMPVGSRLLHAIASAGDVRWGPREVYITEDGGEWKLEENATTGLQVVNNTAEDLIVYVSDEESGKAPAGGAFRILDVKKGSLKLSAKTASGKANYSARFFDIKEGQMSEWKIGRSAAPPPAAT